MNYLLIILASFSLVSCVEIGNLPSYPSMEIMQGTGSDSAWWYFDMEKDSLWGAIRRSRWDEPDSHLYIEHYVGRIARNHDTLSILIKPIRYVETIPCYNSSVSDSHSCVWINPPIDNPNGGYWYCDQGITSLPTSSNTLCWDENPKKYVDLTVPTLIEFKISYWEEDSLYLEAIDGGEDFEGAKSTYLSLMDACHPAYDDLIRP